ncbi:GTP cyclohydrolase II, partial [bacterium]|nr:GTP cyclohydrolase II [bacterium]
HRVQEERFIEKIETVPLPTDFGDFDITCYHDRVNNKEHLVLSKGQISGVDNIMVRVHSECITGDVFHSARCDCGAQLHEAMRMIHTAGQGAILYMRQEGRGIGIGNKLRAYKLQDQGHDTVEANIKLGFPPDLREYGVGAQILLDMGLKSIQLITNNPTKIVGLEGYGIEITGRVPLIVPTNPHNAFYMKTKSKKMGHMID